MLSEDSDTEDVHTLTINEHYGKAYEYRKEREELSKCQFVMYHIRDTYFTDFLL